MARVIKQKQQVRLSDLVREYEDLHLKDEEADPRSWIEIVLAFLVNRPSKDATVLLTLIVLGLVIPKVNHPWAAVATAVTIVAFSTVATLIERSDGTKEGASRQDDAGT